MTICLIRNQIKLLVQIFFYPNHVTNWFPVYQCCKLFLFCENKCATHQEKLFELLFYVLLLNGEHGSEQLVDGRS